MNKRLYVTLLSLVVAAVAVLWGSRAIGPKLVSSTLAVPSAAPSVTQGTWRLVFNGTFQGSTVDDSMWSTCLPGKSSGCTNFGNDEYEWYSKSQAQVYGNALHLVAQPSPIVGESSDGKPETYSCRSGTVNTYKSFQFEYGHLQVIARIPSGPGLWTGLWLAAADREWPPEIDILEDWGAPNSHAGQYLHSVDAPRVSATPAGGGMSAGWHTFDLYWTPRQLTWLVDGVQTLTANKHIPHQIMYFIADLADYSMSEPGSCNGQLEIRSVRVWQEGN